eukprot:7379451-Prymnesium_polylepis.1
MLADQERSGLENLRRAAVHARLLARAPVGERHLDDRIVGQRVELPLVLSVHVRRARVRLQRHRGVREGLRVRVAGLLAVLELEGRRRGPRRAGGGLLEHRHLALDRERLAKRE